MAIKFYKVISNLPSTLQPDSVYFVRSGEGVTLYVTDMTGNIGYTLNGVSSEFVNADMVDGFHANQTPSANTIPVANSDGKLDASWLPAISGTSSDADMVDGFHANQTPAANTIPVADATGKISPKWINVYSLVPYWKVSIDETSGSRTTPTVFTVSRQLKYMSYGTIFWSMFSWTKNWSTLWEMKVKSPSAISITGKIGHLDDNAYIYLNNNLVVSAPGASFKDLSFILNLVSGDNLIQVVHNNSGGGATTLDVQIDFDWQTLEFVSI
jgi:hypothetical protein